MRKFPPQIFSNPKGDKKVRILFRIHQVSVSRCYVHFIVYNVLQLCANYVTIVFTSILKGTELRSYVVLQLCYNYVFTSILKGTELGS